MTRATAIQCDECFHYRAPERRETIGAFNPRGDVVCFACGRSGAFEADDFHEVPLANAEAAKEASKR